jgi:hypothetical protein
VATQLTMFDDINVDLLPAGADAYAGYVDGLFNNFEQIQAKFPRAHLVKIAVFASDNADALDVETGDATIPEVYAWLTRQISRTVYRPIIYISGGLVDRLMVVMNANGFKRSQYRLWSAHYGLGRHICGPTACHVTETACDGTQFTDSALGKSLDESVLLGNFFGTSPDSVPAPAPALGYQYGAPANLAAHADQASAVLTWSAPAVAGGVPPPSDYLVYIYNTTGGKPCNIKTIIPSYPRVVHTTTPSQFGGLPNGASFTAHVVAAGPNGSHIRPMTLATVDFTTG